MFHGNGDIERYTGRFTDYLTAKKEEADKDNFPFRIPAFKAGTWPSNIYWICVWRTSKCARECV